MSEEQCAVKCKLGTNRLALDNLQSGGTSRQTYQVAGVTSKGLRKILRLTNGDRVGIHKFACVSVGDRILLTNEGGMLVRTNDGDVTVLPHYSSIVDFEPAEGKRLILESQEIASQPDYEAYQALSQFHYRSQNSFGKRAILILTCRDLDFPRALGFIEITTSFLSSPNRSALFDAPFESDVGRDVSWQEWDKKTQLKYINTVARISRMVVHPEVRGIGLSRVLVGEAENFCEQRWNVHGMRPLFLEITADMLKFMPFVYSSHMHWIGDSPGNRERIEKDMRYLESKRESGGDHWINRPTAKGIASRQRKDIDKILELKDQFERDGKDIFLQLSKVTNEDNDIDARTYEVLSSLVRYPKPTFMKGLTRKADAFVKARCLALGLKRSKHDDINPVSACSNPIRIRDLTLAFDIDTGLLGATKAGVVRRAFGLPRNFRFSTGIRKLTAEIKPGEICFIYGSSGSGKTALLNLIAGTNQVDANRIVTGNVLVPRDSVIGVLQDEWTDTPLLNSIGARNLDEAIVALNTSGLAEPRLYLSRWNQLSAGQKYRAQLARLICSDSNVWLLDEFASQLDDATALAVGRKFAWAARQRGVICVIASVRRAPLINSVAPNLVIHLNQVADPIVSDNWRRIAGVRDGN